MGRLAARMMTLRIVYIMNNRPPGVLLWGKIGGGRQEPSVYGVMEKREWLLAERMGGSTECFSNEFFFPEARSRGAGESKEHRLRIWEDSGGTEGRNRHVPPYSSAQRLCSLFRVISVDSRGFLLDIFDLTTTHPCYFGTCLFVLLQSLKLIALCVCNMEDSRIPAWCPNRNNFLVSGTVGTT